MSSTGVARSVFSMFSRFLCYKHRTLGVTYKYTTTATNLDIANFFPDYLKHHIRDVTKAHPRMYVHNPEVWKKLYECLTKQGFEVDAIRIILLKAPQVLGKRLDDLNAVIKVFRGYNVGEKKTIQLLSKEPRLFLLNSEAMKVKLGTMFTVFPKTDILKMLRRGECTVAFFLEPWESTMKKLSYIDSEMGFDQAQMLSAKVFNYSLDHVHLRYELFRRCGKFRRPNPKLFSSKAAKLKVIVTSDDVDLPSLTGITLEEYSVFAQMIEEEKEAEKKEQEELDDD